MSAQQPGGDERPPSKLGLVVGLLTMAAILAVLVIYGLG